MSIEKDVIDEDFLSEKKFSVVKEIDVVSSSLKELMNDIPKMITLCKSFKESLQKSTKEQLVAWDRVLKDYEFFEEDVDVNGERVKKITQALIAQARQVGLDKEEFDSFKKKESWSFDW